MEVNTYQGEGVNVAGDPQHIQDMISKAEQPVVTSDTNTDELQNMRPEWLPDKFGSPEDMARAYQELEQRLSTGAYREEQELSPDDMQDIAYTEASEVASLLDERDLDFNVFQEEYNNLGYLTDEAYGALEEAGINKQMVDTWLQGQEAIVQQSVSDIFSTVGGQENYQQMLEWASDNLTDNELNAFNSTVDRLDDAARLAVTGLYARFLNSEGMAPRLMYGDASVDTAPRYESLAQLTEAMRNPKYSSDPAYRAEVQKRLANSNVF